MPLPSDTSAPMPGQPNPFSVDGAWPADLSDGTRPTVQAVRAFVALVHALGEALPIACALYHQGQKSRHVDRLTFDEPDACVSVGQSQREHDRRKSQAAYWPQHAGGDPPRLDNSLLSRKLSAHAALAQAGHQPRLLEGMERFLASLASAVPVFGRPWISAAVSVFPFRMQADKPALHVTLFGKTPTPMLHGKDDQDSRPLAAQTFDAAKGLLFVLDRLACLEAATGFWHYKGMEHSQPIPAASVIEAAYVHTVLHGPGTAQPFGAWLRGPQPMERLSFWAAVPHPDPARHHLAMLQARHPAP